MIPRIPVYQRPEFGPKQMAIINAILTPDYDTTKFIDICCGIGFGKTTLSIILAAIMLENDPSSKIMFLEPDDGRLDTVFWPEWQKWIPARYYRRIGKRKDIYWRNGATLYPRHRWVTGSTTVADDLMRGPNLSTIFDDEAAIGFSLEGYKNALMRLRVASPWRGYISMTTPKVGPYADLLALPGHLVFHGRTADNAHNLPANFEAERRAQMSDMHARRELDGEMVALEGRVWKTWDDTRNITDFVFRNGRPYILAGDIGVQSSWLCCQPDGRGSLVIVSEYHADEGGTRDDMRAVLKLWGQPAKIITGMDLTTTSQVSGESAVIEIKRALNSIGMTSAIPIVTPSSVDIQYRDKSIQYEGMSDIIEAGRLKLSIACKGNSKNEYDDAPAVHGNKNRSFYKMIQQDAWPKPGAAGWFVKDKRKTERGSGIEDVRDAALYLSVVEFPPRIGARAA